ncbi:hypothetical protein [Acidithiobacillus ferriphilus]|uniref:hypothetical protein n=1 Tax=Acidithiobacillus ferriphilus TaxID=1689834 RepID=UPI00232E2F94|nr:hypothetical protein [Acidithiobacillus ferriphilus]WCE94367.1 hypothetical protein PJU76_02155 [Acidithiobacillus ferriphilus]
MSNFMQLFNHIDFARVCRHARRFHGVLPQEIVGESWIYQHLGKTEGQLRSSLRRELNPEFSTEKLNAYAAIQSQGKDPLELLVELEDEIDRQKKQENDEVMQGERDTARLAEALRVSRRRAQQIVRRRREQIEQILAPGGQAEFGLEPPQ